MMIYTELTKKALKLSFAAQKDKGTVLCLELKTAYNHFKTAKT